MVALLILVSACGSAPSGDGLATLDGASAGEAAAGDVEFQAEESVLALTECLRVEGIDIPDPEFDDEGNFRLRSLMELGEAADSIDPDDLEAGLEACSEYLAGVTQLIASIDRSAIEDRLYLYADCMREEGYDMPDPVFDVRPTGEIPDPGSASASGPFGDIDDRDPDFLAANQACQRVFGETFGPGGFGPPVDEGGG